MQQMETIQQSDKNHHTEYLTNGISPHVNMSSDVEEDEDQNDNLDEMEDDDPGKLLNEWLGELNTLKQVCNEMNIRNYQIDLTKSAISISAESFIQNM